MGKSVDSLRNELIKIRTGRAHPSLLDQIMVDYYGTDTPINQVANVTVEDSRTLAVAPWEKQMVPVVEKAIINSGLGLNPATTGSLIRIPMPPLTEERRRELSKLAGHYGENARISVRNVRRDGMDHLKKLKDSMGEDFCEFYMDFRSIYHTCRLQLSRVSCASRKNSTDKSFEEELF